MEKYVLRRAPLTLILLLVTVALAGCSRQPIVTSEKIECHSPNKADYSVKVHKWKFDIVRERILEVVGSAKPAEGIGWEAIVKQTSSKFTEEEAKRMGKVKWFVKTVMLELEYRKELERFRPWKKSESERLRIGSGA